VVRPRGAWKGLGEVLRQCHWEGRGGGQRRLDCQGGDRCTEEDSGSWHVTVGLGVELDAVMENRVHDLVEGHKNTMDKVVVVKEDTHRHGTWDGSHDRGRSLRRQSQRGSRE
jgi:hypothetical protein